MKIFKWVIYILKYIIVNYDIEYVIIYKDKGNFIIVLLVYMFKKLV